MSAVGAIGGCLSIDPEAGPPDTDPAEIVGGQATAEYPSVGLMYTPTHSCSGTLIGCDSFLTAAHCVCSATSGASCQSPSPAEPTQVFLPSAGFFDVISVAVDPQFSNVDAQPVHDDVAVLRLRGIDGASSVTGIVPSPLSSASVVLGAPGVVVGFGKTRGDAADNGIKRAGDVVTVGCGQVVSGTLCWQADTDASTCFGDSGGPLFVTRGESLEVASIHSTVTGGGNCLTGEARDTGVFANTPFIAASAGPVNVATCGDLPSVGQSGAAVTAEGGTLAAGDHVEFDVAVAPGTAELRVGANGFAGVGLHLYAKANEPANSQSFDCKDERGGGLAYCSVASPGSGMWNVQVVNAGNSATDFQMTATVLGSAPVAAADAYEAGVDQMLTRTADEGVLANDQSTGRQPLDAKVVTLPEHGELDLAADGSFTYRPDDGFGGTDSFEYAASDGSYEGRATATIAVGGDGAGGGDDGQGAGVAGGCAAGGGRGGRGGGAPVLVAGAALALALTVRRRRRRAA